MSAWYWVLLGGLIGAPIRFGIGRFVGARWRRAFPLATFLINVTGSFLLGLLYAATGQQGFVWSFFGTGVLGAYTTFSTFGTEAVALLESKRSGLAVLYVLGSALLGLLGAWLGKSCYTGW